MSFSSHEVFIATGRWYAPLFRNVSKCLVVEGDLLRAFRVWPAFLLLLRTYRRKDNERSY